MILRVIEKSRSLGQEGVDAKSCLGLAGGLSLEQVEVASQMMRLKQQVRRLRQKKNRYQQGGMHQPPSTMQAIDREIDTLRQCWAELERSRELAWARKMRALGYDI